nr:MAG TPA: hypothetical protein [Caudoviricetes sp.]
MTHPNSPKQEKFIVSSDGSQPLCRDKDKEFSRQPRFDVTNCDLKFCKNMVCKLHLCR